VGFGAGSLLNVASTDFAGVSYRFRDFVAFNLRFAVFFFGEATAAASRCTFRPSRRPSIVVYLTFVAYYVSRGFNALCLRQLRDSMGLNCATDTRVLDLNDQYLHLENLKGELKD